MIKYALILALTGCSSILGTAGYVAEATGERIVREEVKDQTTGIQRTLRSLESGQTALFQMMSSIDRRLQNVSETFHDANKIVDKKISRLAKRVDKLHKDTN